MHYNDYIKNFMEFYEYPEEAVKVFTDVEKHLDSDSSLSNAFDCIMEKFRRGGDYEYYDALQELDKLSETSGIDERTLKFVFIMNASEWVRDKYKENNIPDEIFVETFRDLKWKLLECMECEYTCGTFVAGWFEHHLTLNIFALGRFQYETNVYYPDEPYYGPDGIVLTKGTPMVSVHIPSSGISLTDDVRMDSYKKAHEFFRDRFPDGITRMQCGSWLLYDKHREFLPKHSNILRFMDDFDIVENDTDPEYHDDWRLFGHYTDLPLKDWAEDTSLRRAYKKWLLDGNPAGSGYGIILFDGEKILRK